MKRIAAIFLFVCFATLSVQAQVVVSNNDTCKNIDKYLTQLAADKNFSGGLLIVKDGKKIFSKGYGWADKENKIPFTPSLHASMGSITKAFTAFAIVKLEEQGKLSVNDNLKKFFPSVPADKANITIHQMLTHSSGFEEPATDGGDYEVIKTEDYLKRVFAQPLGFAPGTKGVYSNVNMSILGIILEQLTGMDYEAYMRKELFQPNGINGISYFYPQTPKDTIVVGYNAGTRWGTHQERFAKAGGGPYWNLKANGGLEVSLNDMYLWINAVSNNKVLSKASLDKVFAPHVLEEGTNGQYSFGYGCNIAKSRRDTKVIDNGGSNGIYHARLLRLPEDGVVFYIVTNENSANANMVLPNITQLYFMGKIADDAMAKSKFNNPLSEEIYKILIDRKPADLGDELRKVNIKVGDDMVLLDVGQLLIEENNIDAALTLYQYYTKAFPNIIVAWNDLGDVYLMKDKKDDAANCYKQALKLRPENKRAKESLAKLGK
jgi:CubicO group peptidase (beta-lactamase class C family)